MIMPCIHKVNTLHVYLLRNNWPYIFVAEHLVIYKHIMALYFYFVSGPYKYSPQKEVKQYKLYTKYYLKFWFGG